ncbi:uncharacterized protein LOC119172069 isoform X2 [Rhipicephalus microplus]|uniref:uncharacterized protein LOC119172069 isoform X2 n=1 Tax=Rhipicephalus microplus TaxID=6941 RepID=UPI003F6AAE6C
MLWTRRPLTPWRTWNRQRRCSAFPAQKYELLSHERHVREALSKTGNAWEDRDCGLEVAMKEFLAGAYSADMYASIRQACGLERSMADFKRASSYQEVGTLTNLFTGIQRKGVPPTEDTEFARANRRRMVTVAQMQQIAQELHNDIATITPYDNDNVEEINSANKQKTLLGNALLSLAFKTVTDTADIRVLKTFSRSLQRFSSSYFDDEEGTGAAEYTPVIRQWYRYQVYNVEALANAFECLQLLARANVVELHAARQCATNLALAIQATKELDRFLNCECHNPKDDQWTLPAILAQAKLNKASEMRHLCGDSSRNSEAEKSQREQDIVDGVSRVIRELTDGVLGYVADCKASEASEALRDIAGRMRITGH